MLRRLAEFRSEHPLVERVDLLIPDLLGIPRGKRLPIGDLGKAEKRALLFSSTVYALDSAGANIDASPLVWQEGDADRPVELVPATLAATPWKAGLAQIIGRLREADGSPFFADPRAVLERVTDRFARLEIRPVAALEFEFYLLAGSRRSGRRPRPHAGSSAVPSGGRVEVYSLDRLRDQQAFLDLLLRYCEGVGIEARAAVAEFAPGQFEVNLRHGDDMLRVADAAFLFKRCVKEAAHQTGRIACFMAKPFADQAGSGQHVHLSLVDRRGHNLFAGAEGERQLRHCIAGMQELMAESMAIFAPNANSYRRLQPLSYAPLSPSWGENNRTVALRVPAGPDAARRIEHRVAGADANPYLVLAAVLAGALHGLERQGDPGPPVRGNAYACTKPTLPRNWYAALRAFEEGRLLRRLLGEAFCEHYLLCREEERQRFDAEVPLLDFDWYLRSV